MNRYFFVPFLLVCACGVFVSMAGGIVWGTRSCGALSLITLVIACAVGGFHADSVRMQRIIEDKEDY